MNSLKYQTVLRRNFTYLLHLRIKHFCGLLDVCRRRGDRMVDFHQFSEEEVVVSTYLDVSLVFV